MLHVGAIEQQNEKAFQKQKGVFLNSKRIVSTKKAAKPKRWVQDVGLGFAIPTAAREGTYIDKKCPFTGQVHIRGRILKGMVISTKMKRTLIVRRHYLHYVSKYNRFEKRHRNIAAHVSPAFEVKEGDIVTIGECRPLAKTVCFNVLKVEPKQIFGSAKKQFVLF